MCSHELDPGVEIVFGTGVFTRVADSCVVVVHCSHADLVVVNDLVIRHADQLEEDQGDKTGAVSPR